MARRGAWTTARPTVVGSEPHCRGGRGTLAGWCPTRALGAYPWWSVDGRASSRGCDRAFGGAQVRTRALWHASQHSAGPGGRVRGCRSGGGGHAATSRRAIASRGHGVRVGASPRFIRRAACRAAPRQRSSAVAAPAVPARGCRGSEGTASRSLLDESPKLRVIRAAAGLSGSQVGVCSTCTQIPLRRLQARWIFVSPARLIPPLWASVVRVPVQSPRHSVVCEGPDSGPVVRKADRRVPFGLERRPPTLARDPWRDPGARAVVVRVVGSIPQLGSADGHGVAPRFLAPTVSNEGHL